MTEAPGIRLTRSQAEQLGQFPRGRAVLFCRGRHRVGRGRRGAPDKRLAFGTPTPNRPAADSPAAPRTVGAPAGTEAVEGGGFTRVHSATSRRTSGDVRPSALPEGRYMSAQAEADGDDPDRERGKARPGRVRVSVPTAHSDPSVDGSRLLLPPTGGSTPSRLLQLSWCLEAGHPNVNICLGKRKRSESRGG